MDKLAAEDIEQKLSQFPDWSASGDSIQRTFSFPDFVQAMGFVDRVAELAERAKHHPDILVRYSKVTLTLSTHDASGVTDKDFNLAGRIDAIVPKSATKSPAPSAK
jgi:4a-hydroxytetrahydrobiopterin dehydratase